MSDEAPALTRRHYLTTRACLAGASIWLAVEAVASTAMEHPEWDMDEKRTWDQWVSGVAGNPEEAGEK